MREIKFRAWDKKFHHFIKDIQEDQAVLDHFHHHEMIERAMTFQDFIEDNGFRFVIEQYTGLEDKNGKSIYEGDILETPFDIGKIVYDNNLGAFLVQYDEYITGYLGIDNLIIGKVIGNIHENADLLKEDED